MIIKQPSPDCSKQAAAVSATSSGFQETHCVAVEIRSEDLLQRILVVEQSSGNPPLAQSSRTDSCCSCDTHATLTCFLLPSFCFSCHRREQGSCDEDSRFVFWTRERLETIVCKYFPLKRVSTSAALVILMKPSHASCFRQSVSAFTEERFEVLWILFLMTRD